MNCLFACNFALKFIYALTGWEGSAANALLWQDALQKDLFIPNGKYLLGDAGFPTSPKLLTPYHRPAVPSLSESGPTLDQE